MATKNSNVDFIGEVDQKAGSILYFLSKIIVLCAASLIGIRQFEMG